MLRREQNELVTRTGPGTPCGALLRRYWQPAALVEELPADRPAIPVRLLGEDLVLFRDQAKRYGLLDRHCSHRGADLCYGRLEDGGIRCAYHGWLYDVAGRCLEQPAEPPESTFHEEIRHRAYPCRERNGIVFAYLGPGEPPPLPGLDGLAAPDPYTFAFKGHIDCNWLQALEGGIDPAHVSFLHRFFVDKDPEEGYGQQFRDWAAGSEIPQTRIVRERIRPEIEVEETGYGLRIATRRALEDDRTHVRITNLAFPNTIVIPFSRDMVITQWQVPIDDGESWWYAIFASFGDPVDKETMREQRLALYTVPDYRPRRNRDNRYGFDPREQRELTFTGMGMDINVHDNWAMESPGRIQDRTKEHLGTTDRAIAANRRLLLRAIKRVEDGSDPGLGVPPGDADRDRLPVAADTVAPAGAWQAGWREHDRERRERSAWAGAEAEPTSP